jgi:hypothetical protein
MFQRALLPFAAVLGLSQVAHAQTAVGPRGPVGPQASVTCTGTQLTPGANIQSAVNSKPGGTTFCLAAGAYTKQHVVPKAGDKFIGAVGTILDGQNSTNRAFASTATSTNVTVQNLIVQNYIGGYQVPAIDGQYATGWSILNNEVRQNDGVGIAFAGSALVQFNYLHHNLEMGYGSNPGSGIVMTDNEIAFNNYTDKYDCGDECGGGKLWSTTGAVVSYNYTHDNHGPGLWDDYDNNNITYSFNRIENNSMMGIHHEISYNASIHDNTFLNNGSNSAKNDPKCNWLWCAAISIAASGGVGGGSVEIYNNSITTGSPYGNAIGLIQQNRQGEPGQQPCCGPWYVQSVWAHDNTIDLSKGGSIGGVQDLGNNAIFTARNNKFDRNHYILGTNTKGPFWWNNKQGNKAFWQSKGMDLNGTFQ